MIGSCATPPLQHTNTHTHTSAILQTDLVSSLQNLVQKAKPFKHKYWPLGWRELGKSLLIQGETMAQFHHGNCSLFASMYLKEENKIIHSNHSYTKYHEKNVIGNKQYQRKFLLPNLEITQW